MSENTPNDLQTGLKNLIKMGVGAVVNVVEKGKEFATELTTEGTQANTAANQMKDEFTQKGAEAIRSIKDFGASLLEQLNDGKGELDALLGSLEAFSKEELGEIKDKIDELLARTDDEPQTPDDAPQTPDANEDDPASAPESGEKPEE